MKHKTFHVIFSVKCYLFYGLLLLYVLQIFSNASSHTGQYTPIYLMILTVFSFEILLRLMTAMKENIRIFRDLEFDPC